MKHKLYKQICILFAIGFLGTTFAQKFDKKFTENFKVNKDVAIELNAANTEINVTTWSKNEVQIEAFIEIEGLSKEEAETYFKNWNFEALGNKKKVQITSKGNNSFGLKDDFVIFNNMNFDFEIPEIEMPDFDAMVIPDMNFDFDFDFDFDFESLEDLEENMQRDGDYSFEYHKGDEHIKIKTKEEWEQFKKSKNYDDLKKSFKTVGSQVKIALANSKNQIKKINKEQLKASLEQAKLSIKNIDTKAIQKSILEAQKVLKNMNFSFNKNSDDLTINGKKVKIKKRLEIKVPKGATFNLNTRHCKVKLPNTVASGKVKYGAFNANDLIGGNLTIDYSPVNISSLNACTLFLNNVTDAKIASVTNTTMSNNSSEVVIDKINNSVKLSDKFGKITIESFDANFGDFVLNLSNSEAVLPLNNLNLNMNIETVKSRFLFQSNKDNFIAKIFNKMAEKESSIKNGIFSSGKKTDNLLKLNANYSVINVN